jgi:hypothetical protein
MNARLILLALTSAIALTACPTPPAPTPGDTSAPTIVSITPNNGAIGLAADAKIVITFSEAMNKTATELAYQSNDMLSVSFTWSEGDTKLEIDPVNDLIYTPTGKNYDFKLSNTATDLAGNQLNEISSTFKTFRQLSKTLESSATLDGDIRSDGEVNAACLDRICVGDSSAVDNAQYKGYLSFNLASLETDGLTTSDRIVSANLRVYQSLVQGAPYTDLKLGSKGLIVEHTSYGSSLTATDFNTDLLGAFPETGLSPAIAWKDFDGGRDFVRNDWDNRATRGNRSQYVLFFAKATDGDGNFDIARFNSSNSVSNHPELVVKFLVP